MILTKKEMVYEAIREIILNGEIKPGERITISKIAKSYDVSEIPVREALQQIEADGLIINKPHAGYRVAPMDEKELYEVFQLRAYLEGLATRLAIPSIPDDVIDRLGSMIDLEKSLIDQKDFAGYRKLNISFHTLIYQFCGNDKLIKLIMDLWANTKRYPSMFDIEENVKASHQDHILLLEAIRDRDSKRAEEIEIMHKMRAYEAILLLIKKIIE